ncbi:MAG TPA: hypothetical protein VFR41_08570 [Acidimicrobiia bacterium]|nr:hypothetical protein [Acidimicrobiia bacterium]
MLGALGKREAELGGDTHLSTREKPVVWRQVLAVVAQAILVGVVGAVVVWLL